MQKRTDVNEPEDKASQTTRQGTLFVRIVVGVVSVLIAFVIVFSLCATPPRGQITMPTVMLAAILVVLTLSEVFDNLSVGKVLTLKREVARAEDESQNLRAENHELRKQIVTVASSMSQRQHSMNFMGFPDDWRRAFAVEKATPEEVEERQEPDVRPIVVEPQAQARPRLNYRKVSEWAVGKYVQARQLEQYNVVREAKLSALHPATDPIGNVDPIFDAYLKAGSSELFFQVLLKRRSMLLREDRLYLLLSKLNQYRTAMQASVQMILLIVDGPNEVFEGLRGMAESGRPLQRLTRTFEPSILSSLLRIEEVKVAEAEVEDLLDD